MLATFIPPELVGLASEGDSGEVATAVGVSLRESASVPLLVGSGESGFWG